MGVPGARLSLFPGLGAIPKGFCTGFGQSGGVGGASSPPQANGAWAGVGFRITIWRPHGGGAVVGLEVDVGVDSG